MKRCLACGHAFHAAPWRCPACAWEPVRVGGIPCFAPALDRAPDGYDPAHLPILRSIEDRSFWFPARNRLLLWALARAFPRARHILEIGVGTGVVLGAVGAARPDAVLAGTDMTVASLERCARRLGPAVALYQMDARAVPFREEFDVVAVCDVLEHIEAHDVVLREIHAALRPGGGVLITVPQHPALWGPADEAAGHVRRYTRRELLGLVASAGFEALLVTSFVSLLAPALAAARWQSRRRGSYDLAREHVPPPWLNRICAGAMAVERGAIRAGVRFPFGGSLLVAARRA